MYKVGRHFRERAGPPRVSMTFWTLKRNSVLGVYHSLLRWLR